MYPVHRTICVPCTLYNDNLSTLYDLFTVYTVQSVNPVHCTICVPCALYNLCTLYIAQSMYPIPSTIWVPMVRSVYPVYRTICVSCTLYNLCSLYIVQSMYPIPRTICVPCTLYNLCTLTLSIVQSVYHLLYVKNLCKISKFDCVFFSALSTELQCTFQSLNIYIFY